MDLIIWGGNVLTMDAANPRADAVAIRDGKIAAAGSNEEILRMLCEHTVLIDAGGHSVLPGFNDSHLHLYGYANTKTWVDLSCLTSIDMLQEKLRSHKLDAALTPGAWIVGRGWDQTPYPEIECPAVRIWTGYQPVTPSC